MKLTKVYTDSAGKSQFKDQGDLRFESLTKIDFISKPHESIGKLSEKITVSSMRIHQYDTNLNEDWHNPPLGKTYIIFLEGAQEIEVDDGTKRIFSYGDILLLDDLTGRGHRTRAVKSGISIILT